MTIAKNSTSCSPDDGQPQLPQEQNVNESLPSTTRKPGKKRPRPAQLDLKSSNLSSKPKDMNEFALKCISPGLPPLSARMKSTILISQSISEQQKKLIRSRINPGASEDAQEDHSDPNQASDEPPSGEEVSSTGLTGTLDALTMPSSTTSNKRLKRDKAPAPLNLSRANSAARPLIRSAPIANFNPVYAYMTPASAARSQLRKRSIHQQQKARHQKMLPATPFDSVYLPPYPGCPLPTSAYPYAPQQSFAPRAIPKTATALRNPSAYLQGGIPLSQHQLARYQQQVALQQQSLQKFQDYRQSLQRKSHVTDIFNNKTEFAPIEAQPLSSQKEFFDIPKDSAAGFRTANKSRLNGSDETNDKDTEGGKQDDDEEDDVESKAIEPDAQPGLRIRKKGKIASEIRILNNVFRFTLERKDDSLANDRKRFLNHCAAAWNEFIKM